MMRRHRQRIEVNNLLCITITARQQAGNSPGGAWSGSQKQKRKHMEKYMEDCFRNRKMRKPILGENGLRQKIIHFSPSGCENPR
ncbi:hypothetical protein YA28_00370 [Klebsiella aerogenes]|nr:hypothetical protein YA28_00370 [Klebsiella aerogenes]KUQ19546.1 hypothetical protein AWI09_09770 [Klebsiella aerogenes]KUR15168.1 hypothetical protein AWI35_13630 [Klebsiella aerogenes]